MDNRNDTVIYLLCEADVAEEFEEHNQQIYMLQTVRRFCNVAIRTEYFLKVSFNINILCLRNCNKWPGLECAELYGPSINSNLFRFISNY